MNESFTCCSLLQVSGLLYLLQCQTSLIAAGFDVTPSIPFLDPSFFLASEAHSLDQPSVFHPTVTSHTSSIFHTFNKFCLGCFCVPGTVLCAESEWEMSLTLGGLSFTPTLHTLIPALLSPDQTFCTASKDLPPLSPHSHLT